MISIGGRLPSSRQALGQEPDPWVSGIGIFDMTEFAWADLYTADAAAYESPKVIKDYYASDYKEPEWSDNALAPVFGEFMMTYSEFRTLANVIVLQLSLHRPRAVQLVADLVQQDQTLTRPLPA